LTSEEIFRAELHTLFFRPFLDDATLRLGPERVANVLRDLGVNEEQLRDPTGWVSLRFREDFFDALLAAGEDEGMFDRCGRLIFSNKYGGTLLPLFRAFANPVLAYGHIVQSFGRVNKVGRLELREAQRGFVSLEYRPIRGAPVERGIYVCRARAAQLAAVPIMFDFAPATVDHPVCLNEGGEVCRYDLTWADFAGRWPAWSFPLTALALGAVAAVLWPRYALASLAVSLLAGATAWALGRNSQLRQVLAAQAANLTDTQEALAHSVRFHEERFAELTEAKAEVERKVEERTTEIREVNQRLAGTLEEVRSLEHAERNFFANISHDLRTPLTLILAPLESLLVASGLSVAERRSIETLQRNAQQLRRLIDQLLDVEKIHAGRTEIVRVPTDVRALVENLVEKFSGEATKRKLRLEFAVAGELRTLAIDAGWIDSALMNLVANATRFAASAIRIRVHEVADGILVEVEDDGPGIPRDQLPHIFDRFVQAGTPRERRGGSGLGLAIAREAVRLHGGMLTVASEVGKGTVFTMTLPRAAGDTGAPVAGSPLAPLQRMPSAEIPTLSLSAPQRRQKAWKGPAADSPLVVVIEDDDELRIFIAETLAARYRVEVASDGEEGLALVRARRPDAVVSDIAMPRLDGTELCRRLRAAPETRALPILLVTARRQADRVLEGFEAGANDYIAKPFHPRELLARLEAHLVARRVVQEMAHRERLVSLGVLAASVAHQVRNPLSAMKNTVVALQRRVTAETVPGTAPMFGLITDCIERIEKFTRDLLDLSRIERPDGGDFRPAPGIESAVRLLSTRLPPGVRVTLEVDSAVELTGKPGEMNYVFMNLIDNAIRAVGTSGRVEVRGNREGDDFVLEVADSGAGVPEDRRRWIFEPFATTRASDGTGLGLYIAQRVVVDHGGDISVSTSNLGGALFRVRIPTAPGQRRLAAARGSAGAS
jgi:signal transduction histidine kinase